jgi:hypothetical protein
MEYKAFHLISINHPFMHIIHVCLLAQEGDLIDVASLCRREKSLSLHCHLTNSC